MMYILNIFNLLQFLLVIVILMLIFFENKN